MAQPIQSLPTLWAVLMVLFATVGCVQYGDYSPLASGATFKSDSILLQMYTNPLSNEVVVYLRTQGFDPVEILYRTAGLLADLDLVKPTSTTFELVDSHLSGTSSPSTDNLQNLRLLGYESDLSSYIAVKYAKPLLSEYPADVLLQIGRQLTFRMVYPSLKKQRLKQASYKGQLSNSISTSLSDASDVDLGELHGVLLTLCWCFLADLAVWVKYIYELKQRTLVHGAIMSFCVVASLAMQALALSGLPLELSQYPNEFSAHLVIGLIALAWISLQFILGIALRVLLANKDVPPTLVVFLRKMHRVSGYLLLILAKANTLIGWYISDTLVAFGILLAEIVVVFVLRLLYARRMSQKMLGKQQLEDYFAKGSVAPEDSSVEELTKLPYNHPRVQESGILLFNDKVYRIPSDHFHPGGRKIIELVKGREVDRFVYGMFSPELLPGLERFEHPKKTLFVLDSPLYVLPSNPLCTLPESDFYLKSKIQITEDTKLLYFEPFGGRIKFQPLRSSVHLGQYYTMTGFGMTRLYTCVLSQLRSNRRLCDRLVEELIRQEEVLKNQFELNPNSMLTEQSFVELEDQSKAKRDVVEDYLPLIIKRYRNRPESFTHLFYAASKPEVHISGPKGRGLCLDAVPRGDIVLIAGGTGLFPFLDLLDLLFKATVAGKTKTLIPANELEVAQALVKEHVFHVFISVTSVQELVVPDELNIICQLKPSFVKLFLRVREGVRSGCFEGCLLEKQTRLDGELIRQRVLPLERLQMVYICGTQEMYRDLTGYLNEGGVNSERIFFV